jgi:tetratricopeptide (TPR) repeat protein
MKRSGLNKTGLVSRGGAKVILLSLLGVAAAALLVVGAVRRQSGSARATPAPPPGTSAATAAYAGSSSCRECHPKFHELWSTSFHGLALQPYTPELGKKLRPHTNDLVAGKYAFRADIERGVVIERGPEGTNEYKMVQATGGKNIYYFLTELDRGLLQTLPAAYDVRHQEWIDTTASAVRHFGDATDEALYWKERPLTFNTSCYGCHVSQMEKNYDLATDSYRTTWAEPGINCETCHGPAEEHVKLFKNWPTNQPPPADLKLIVTRKLSITQRSDMCGPCHAKMSPITPSFSPGERYFDHFDLVGLEDRDFYPDGRDLGENYTFTHWLMNPCAKSGKMDCIHCHTSSGRYRFHEPAKANHACLPCHAERVENATAHTRHPEGSEGNKCVSCHMPMTEFARMRRSDHTMRPPAPAATLKFGSPNACNLCHTTNSPAWADKTVREWRKRDYQKPIIEEGDLILAARKGDWTRLPAMLAFAEAPDTGEVQAAAIVRLLANCPEDSKWPALRRLALKNPSPLVRSSAADSLGSRLDAAAIEALVTATADDFRLVRVRAAASLSALKEDQWPAASRPQVRIATAEYIQSMQSTPDSMASHYSFGNYHMSRGDARKAIEEYQIAMRLQPGAIPPYANAALAYNALGQNDKAEESLRKALGIDPTNASVNLNLGMLLAEMQKLPEAEAALRAALKADPQQAQAAYNLGLMLSSDKPDEALEFAKKAASIRPQEARYTYACALFLHRAGRTREAVDMLEKSLANLPAHPETYILLGQIYERGQNPAKALDVYNKGAGNNSLPESARAAFKQRVGVLQGEK